MSNYGRPARKPKVRRLQGDDYRERAKRKRPPRIDAGSHVPVNKRTRVFVNGDIGYKKQTNLSTSRVLWLFLGMGVFFYGAVAIAVMAIGGQYIGAVFLSPVPLCGVWLMKGRVKERLGKLPNRTDLYNYDSLG